MRKISFPTVLFHPLSQGREVISRGSLPPLPKPFAGQPRSRASLRDAGSRGWSRRVLFVNDRNVAGYVIGILILLLQGAVRLLSGPAALLPTSHVEPNKLGPGKGRDVS